MRHVIGARPFLLLVAVLVLLAAPAAAKPGGPKPKTHPGGQGAIAFGRTVSLSPPRINVFRMDVDGSNVVNLTNNTTSSDGDPIWSGSGTQIAFVSNRDGNQEIYRMTASGDGVKRLTTDAAEDGNPSWYPRDNKVIYESRRTGNFELWVQRVGSNGDPIGGPIQMTKNSRTDAEPSVSPDGKFIVFSSDRITKNNPEGDIEIFVMKASGPEGPNNRPKQLTKNDHEDVLPDWSPNGKQIAFASDRDARGTFVIYTMTNEGNKKQRLTPLGFYASAPTWSPDGKRLAFFGITTKGDVYRINADGSQLTNLTEAFAGDSTTPAWQPR